MLALILWQNRLLAAALVGAVAVGGVWGWGEWRYRQGVADGRAALELEQRQAAQAMRDRLGDADVGEGDPDDDLCWLARRLRIVPAAGVRGPCP